MRLKCCQGFMSSVGSEDGLMEPLARTKVDPDGAVHENRRWRQPMVGKALFCRSRASGRCGQNGYVLTPQLFDGSYVLRRAAQTPDPRTCRPDRLRAVGSRASVCRNTSPSGGSRGCTHSPPVLPVISLPWLRRKRGHRHLMAREDRLEVSREKSRTTDRRSTWSGSESDAPLRRGSFGSSPQPCSPSSNRRVMQCPGGWYCSRTPVKQSPGPSPADMAWRDLMTRRR